MDGAILLGARLVAAGALAYAGTAKLFDREGLQDASEALGVPTGLAVVTGWLLPPAELLVAVMLVCGATAWLGALGASALFAAFTALILNNLVHGRRPSCHCFGADSSPISWWSVARNAVLIVTTLIVLAGGSGDAGPGLLAFAGDRLKDRDSAAAVTLLSIAVLVQAAVLVHLLRRVRRLESVSVAAPPAMLAADTRVLAPEFLLPTLDGHEQSLRSLRELGRPVLLLYTSPTCRPCRALLPEIADWQRLHRDALTIAVLTNGSPADNRDKADAVGLLNVMLQDGDEVARAYSMYGTPGAVLVDPDGRIASEPVVGAPEIRALVSTAARNGESHQHAAPAVIRPREIGQDAPDVVLRNLEGTPVGLAQYLGRMIVVLFWSPTCGFCEDMLPAWREWEESAVTADGVPAVVITRGTVDANRGQQFHSAVLVDTDGLTQRAFGADATPMAVLVDAEGRIASPVAAGAPDVLALAERASVLTRVAHKLAPSPKKLLPISSD